MKALYIIIFLSFLLGCQTTNKNESSNTNQEYYSYYREDGLMREEFWGKGEENDIPYSFESVTIDKNGKVDNKGGDTHFHFLDEEVGVSYYYYDNSEMALNRFQEDIHKAKKLIRKGIIINEKGEQVGEKALVLKRSTVTNSNYYSLIWTRNSRLSSVSGDSLKAIEAYENDRKL
jgi:hypothetical protein